MPIISDQKLAELAGCSRRMIGKYVKMGMPKVARGQYDQAACLTWIAEFQDTKPGNQAGTLNEERARVAKLQADFWELRISTAEGMMMLVETHEQHLRLCFSAVKAAMNAYVAKARDSSERNDRQKAVDDALRDAAQRIEGMLSDAARGFELTPAKVRNGRRLGRSLQGDAAVRS